MGEKLSKVSLPNSAGTTTVYEFKDRYAADIRIIDEELNSLFALNEADELTAPVLAMTNNNNLSIIDESGLAAEFDVLVDGKLTKTLTANS